MAAIDLSQFHELAEQFRNEIPLKHLCEQEGVSYRRYLSWRKRMGIAMRRTHLISSAPEGMIEVSAEDGVPTKSVSHPPCTADVHIVFENGLSLDRQQMEVDALIDFLSKIRDVLCLG